MLETRRNSEVLVVRKWGICACVGSGIRRPSIFYSYSNEIRVRANCAKNKFAIQGTNESWKLDRFVILALFPALLYQLTLSTLILSLLPIQNCVFWVEYIAFFDLSSAAARLQRSNEVTVLYRDIIRDFNMCSQRVSVERAVESYCTPRTLIVNKLLVESEYSCFHPVPFV